VWFKVLCGFKFQNLVNIVLGYCAVCIILLGNSKASPINMHCLLVIFLYMQLQSISVIFHFKILRFVVQITRTVYLF